MGQWEERGRKREEEGGKRERDEGRGGWRVEG
jgi:hypothetical protein